MTRFLLLFSLLITITTSAWAQTDFQPGYIIKLTGDTVRGEVDNRDARRSATRARFRAPGAGSMTEYQPSQLRGYGLSGSRDYQAVPVLLADSTTQPTFMELLEAGTASLFYLRTPDGVDHFYLRTPAGAVRELIQRQVEVKRDGSTFLEEESPFRQVLAQAFAGCLPVQAKLPRLPLQAPRLAQVVASYNAQCGGGTIRPRQQAPKGRFRPTLSVVGGVQFQQMTFDGEYTTQLGSNRTVSPTLGAALRVPAPLLSQRLAFVLYAQYERQKYGYEGRGTFTGGFPRQERVRLDLTYLRLPLVLRFTFPGRLRALAEVGFSNGIVVTGAT